MPNFNTGRTAICLLAFAAGLGGCATASAPADKTVYDFGAIRAEAPQVAAQPVARSPLAMAASPPNARLARRPCPASINWP